jgi:Flp pilus assembly protein protease CpaA
VLVVKLVLTAWLIAVAFRDLRTGIIPNWLTLPVMGLAGGFRLLQVLYTALSKIPLVPTFATLVDERGNHIHTFQLDVIEIPWLSDPQALTNLALIFVAWVLCYLMWQLNIINDDDAKLLMGLFAIFPTTDFALFFAVVVVIVSVPVVIRQHWGKSPASIGWGILGRIFTGQFFPTREELATRGRRYAWVFCLPGVLYLWLPR